MTFDPELFAALNHEATAIADQNARYVEAGQQTNRRYGREQQVNIAGEQAALLEALGELADELPYAELASAYRDIGRDFELRRLAAATWAGRLAYEMPYFSDASEGYVTARLADIDTEQLAFEDGELASDHPVGRIALAYRTAIEPWPLPIAFQVEDSVEPVPKKLAPEEEASPPPLFEEPVERDFIPQVDECEPPYQEQSTNGSNGNYQLDQPNASALAAAYLMRISPASVAPHEMVEEMYGHVKDKRDPARLVCRVRAVFQNDRQGRSVWHILDDYGYAFQRGWGVQTPEANGDVDTPSAKKRREYRAVPFSETTKLGDNYEEERLLTR